MVSPQTPKPCAEHKLPITNKNDERVKQGQRAQWLRAAILGANDGLLSTTSLMLGIGAAKEDRWSMILFGLAGALAGACSMAVGEFVSVATQRDIEMATIDFFSSKANLHHGEDHTIAGAKDLKDHSTTVDFMSPKTSCSVSSPPTPSKVIVRGKLTPLSEASEGKGSPAVRPVNLPHFSSPAARSPVMKTRTRDAGTTVTPETEEEVEVGLPNPYNAAAASAVSFLVGSLVPLVSAVFVVENSARMWIIVVVTSIALALFGGVGAHLGGSSPKKSALRVLLGGWIAMAITYGLLRPFSKQEHTD